MMIYESVYAHNLETCRINDEWLQLFLNRNITLDTFVSNNREKLEMLEKALDPFVREEYYWK